MPCAGKAGSYCGTGWRDCREDAGRPYYRVLQPGWIRPGDALQLLARPAPDWSVRRVLDVLHRRTLADEELQTLSQLAGLALKARQLAQQRLQARR